MEGETLLTNHACQIFYAPRLDKDATALSKMLGNKTVDNISRNIGSGGGGSKSQTSRALMLEQELRSMDFTKEIITIDNGRPILANKAFYYNDRYFMDKFKEVSPSLKAVKGIPNRKQLESAIQGGETKTNIPVQSEKTLKEYIQKQIELRLEELSKIKDDEIDEMEEMLKNINEEIEKFDEEENAKLENNEVIDTEKDEQ